MPRGVTDQFLRILDNERKLSIRAAAVAAGLAPVAYFMAELTDQPPLGHVVLLALVAILAGVGAGVAFGYWRTRTYNESIRSSWNAWMRMSISCTRVDEVARHVQRRQPMTRLTGVGWAALLVVNALLFALLWTEVSWALAFGAVITVVNGIVLGGLAGQAAWNLRWTRSFTRALDELVAEGQIGLWGEV